MSDLWVQAMVAPTKSVEESWVEEVLHQEPQVAIADRNTDRASCGKPEAAPCPHVNMCWEAEMCIQAYEAWMDRPHIWEGDFT